MHFKRKKTKARWVSPGGCSCCRMQLRQVPGELKFTRSDRKRYQSAESQLRNDATGSKPSFRYQHKSLTGIIINW